MSEKRIDSAINIAAIKTEVDYLDKSLTELAAKIKEFPQVKGLFEGADNLKKLTTAQRENAKAGDELDKINAQIAAGQQRLNALRSDAAKQLAALREQLKQQNDALKDEAKLNSAADGAISQKRVQLKQLIKDYDDLSAAQRNASQGTQLLAQIQKLDTELKQLEGTTGRFQRNVGNYQGSAKIIVDAFNSAKIKVQELNSTLGPTSPEAMAARKEFEALGRITENPGFLNISAKLGDATAELKFFQKSLIDLEQQGLGRGDTANQLRAQLAELTKQIHDTRGEVKALASDTRGFDLFAGAVSTLVSVAQTAAGATELFGVSNDNVTKSIQKLVAIQSLSNGVHQIAEQLTKKGTAANKLYALAQAEVAVLTNASTTATEKFSAALKLSGIGLLITGVTFLITKLLSLSDSEDKVADSAALMTAQLENQTAALNNNISSIQKSTELLIARAKEQGKSEKDAMVITMASQQAQVKAYQDAIIEKTFMLDQFWGANNKRLDQVVGDQKSAEAELARLRIEFAGTTDETQKKSRQNTINFLQDLVKTYTDFNNAQTDLNITIANKIALQNKIAKDAAKKSFEEQIKALQDLRKAEIELFNLKVGIAADEQQTIANVVEFDLATRKTAFNTEFELRKSMVQKKREFDLAQISDNERLAKENGTFSATREKQFAAERLLINTKADNDLIFLERSLTDNLLRIRNDLKIQTKQAEDETLKALKDDEAEKLRIKTESLKKQFELENQRLSGKKSEDLLQLTENFNNGLTEKKRYLQRSQEIELEYQSSTLQNQLKFYQDQLDILKQNGEDTTAIEAEIAAAKSKIEEFQFQTAKAIADQRVQLTEELKNKQLELFTTVEQAFQSYVDGVFDRNKNKIQEQIDSIDKWKQAEIDRINATSDSEEKKAAKIKIVEAEAQNQREKLQLKQRQLDQKKAIFDKAIKIFELEASTNTEIGKIQAVAAVARAQAQALLTNPLTAPFYPGAIANVGLIQAQIPILKASSLANLIAILATPIPKFGVGKNVTSMNDYEGLSLVGEVGRELRQDPDGKTILYTGPTLTHVKKGTKIFPNNLTEDILAGIGLEQLAALNNVQPYASEIDLTEVVEQLKELNKKPTQFFIHNEHDITSTPWFKKNMKY